MFAEAKAMGAGYIRLDVSLDDIFDVWTGAATEPRSEGRRRGRPAGAALPG